MNWSEWLPAGSTRFEFRYRVQRRDDPKREEEAAKAAREKFVRDLPADAPLEQYLATIQDQDWDTRNRVAPIVSARAVELIPLLESGDRRRIEMALQAATGVNPLPASFEAPLLEVLRGLLRSLRELHASEQTDPDQLEAAALQMIFINWFTSWKNCHYDRKVVPAELGEFLAEARKFDRKQLEDAANIAVLGKQYLGEWSVTAPVQ